MKFLKRFLYLTAFLLVGYGLIVYNNNYISKISEKYIYNDVSKVPSKKVALVLGTAKYIGKNINYYYKYRLDATYKLYKSGKIKYILVSGDNSTKRYDEPTSMRDDLVNMGIPKKNIAIDYAGFRTLDSIVRAKYIFGLDDFIIVSQKFHLQRAIYIALAKNQKAIGFAAKSFENTIWKKRMEYRELLARVKAFLDLYILHTKPKFLGKKVEVFK